MLQCPACGYLDAHGIALIALSPKALGMTEGDDTDPTDVDREVDMSLWSRASGMSIGDATQARPLCAGSRYEFVA